MAEAIGIKVTCGGCGESWNMYDDTEWSTMTERGIVITGLCPTCSMPRGAIINSRTKDIQFKYNKGD
jgi:hypothetical protein